MPTHDERREAQARGNCEYCLDNPAEPKLPCCANQICLAEYYQELEEAKY